VVKKHARKQSRRTQNQNNCACRDCGKKIAITDMGIVEYPEKHSEFEIQAHIYTKLKELGVDIRGEVLSTNNACRCDLVIFEDQKPVLVLEVKKMGKISDTQRAKYEKLGVRFLVVVGMSGANYFIKSYTNNGWVNAQSINK
jgi:hypothetical protein